MREKKVNILLAEDSPLDIKLVQEALTDSGASHHLHVVTDGEDVLDFLRKKGKYANAVSPAIILLDLNLPRKDGREILAEIKSDPLLCHIPVVVLTSSRAEQDIVKTYELQANCYVMKPMDVHEFLDTVRAIAFFWLAVASLPSLDA